MARPRSGKNNTANTNAKLARRLL